VSAKGRVFRNDRRITGAGSSPDGGIFPWRGGRWWSDLAAARPSPRPARSCAGGAACARSRGGCGVDAIAGPRAAAALAGSAANDGARGVEQREKGREGGGIGDEECAAGRRYSPFAQFPSGEVSGELDLELGKGKKSRFPPCRDGGWLARPARNG
jgi:hypothetical protein